MNPKCPTCGTGIRDHESGRCLNRWIAEAVMGWTPTEAMMTNGWWSDSIEGAWDVLEELRGRDYEVSIADHKGKDGGMIWGVDFYKMVDSAQFETIATANAPYAPLAICRAAILAVAGGDDA